MAADRLTYFGHRDYTGENIQNIINRLEEFHTSICNKILILEDTKDELNKLRDKLDDPDSIIETIDYFCILFRRFREDFKRLIDELPSSVQGRHLEIIKQITERLIHEKWNAIEFSIKHTVRALKDESLRPLLDDIYVTIQRIVSGFPPELGSMHNHKKFLFGCACSRPCCRLDNPIQPS